MGTKSQKKEDLKGLLRNFKELYQQKATYQELDALEKEINERGGKILTNEEYNKIPKDYRSVWEVERWDIDNWSDIREDHIGKRTYMTLIDGSTCLLIEDLHFVIIDTRFIHDGLTQKDRLEWYEHFLKEGFLKPEDHNYITAQALAKQTPVLRRKKMLDQAKTKLKALSEAFEANYKEYFSYTRKGAPELTASKRKKKKCDSETYRLAKEIRLNIAIIEILSPKK